MNPDALSGFGNRMGVSGQVSGYREELPGLWEPAAR